MVRGQLDRRRAVRHIEQWTAAHVEAGEQEQFRDVAESELLSLHEGNFARYRIRPSEFAGWQAAWG